MSELRQARKTSREHFPVCSRTKKKMNNDKEIAIDFKSPTALGTVLMGQVICEYELLSYSDG